MKKIKRRKTIRGITLIMVFVFVFQIFLLPLGDNKVFAQTINSESLSEDILTSTVQETEQVVTKQNFDAFRYALFSGGSDTDLNFYGSEMNVIGDVHSNGNFIGYYYKLNINGNLETVKEITTGGSITTIGNKVTKSNELHMPDFYQKLIEKYNDTAKIYYDSTYFNCPTVNINEPMIVHGDVNFNNAEVAGKGFILADKNININVSNLKANDDTKIFYYSSNGNITINASDTEINGILYAPNGTVTLQGSNITVNGRIVANKIVLSAGSININSSPEDLQLINEAPVVTAGEDQEIDIDNSSELQGTVEDEGLIDKELSIKWEKESGPGDVTFDSIDTPTCNAKFSQSGEYVLKLSAYDGQYTSSDTVKVIVKEISKPNLVLNIGGKQIENRKVILDASSSTSNPKYPLLNEETEWNIVPITEGLSQEDIKIDADSTSELIKELIFKKAGDYKISVKIVNEKESAFVEQIITILPDEKPIADFKVDPSFLRDPSNNNMACITLKDMSYSPDNDVIAKRIWKVRYDSNNDGIFDNEDYKIIDENNNIESVYFTSRVGKYRVDLEVVESFEDTIQKFLTDDDYKKGDTSAKTIESKTFVVDNVKPETHIEMQKAKNADIVFTVGKADFNKINDFSNKIEAFKKKLKDQGINANITTVSTSSVTASDSFAWDTYDHCNNGDSSPILPQHITISGKDIKMTGYCNYPYKDFLFLPDDNKTQKTFTFDMSRDGTGWHSIEGGGFLFNSSIKDGKIKGFCVLVTQEGIKLDKIAGVNVDSFRNGTYPLVQSAGSLLKTFPIKYPEGDHSFKIVVDTNTISLWDNGVLIIDNFSLPANDYGSGFGPITSHAKHSCSQQSYFTFKNIVMQTVKGKSLAEVLNEQEWRYDAEKFVVNLSDDEVQDLKTDDMISKVSEVILQKGINFEALGTSANESQYKALIKGIAGNGNCFNTTDFDLAMYNLENCILSKTLSKNYAINYYVNQGEEVSYIDTFKDVENDPIILAKWKYTHDPIVFDNNSGTIDFNDIYINKSITIFDKVGAYGITLKALDNPVLDSNFFDEYRKWSDETELSKAIVVQRRPIAKLDVILTLSSDKTTCYTTMQEDCYDLDHQNSEDKGIVSREYKWKKVSDETWTEGRLPGKLSVGQDYLVMMIVKDKEGTYSDPAVKLVSTKSLIKPIPVVDTEKPTLTLKLSKTEANIGDIVQVYVDAQDNIGIDRTEIYIDGKLASVALGARINFAANEVKTIPVEARVVDPSGNETSVIVECKVVDNRDKVSPVVQISTPKPGALIISPTQIIGTATDDVQLVSYMLQYRLKGATDYITFAQGTEPKSNGILGVFDPTTLANGTYEVRLIAEDAIGNSSYFETTYIVDRTKLPGADKEKPTIELALSKNTANIGEEVQATIEIADNVKVDKASIYIDGNLVMEDQGTLTFTANEAKIMKVEVSAIDSSGNEERETAECQFIDTSDKIAPQVNISSPIGGTSITKATEFIGTANDETGLQRYRLQYRLEGDTDYITFLESTTPKIDEALGIFDPTLLEAGIYEVRLIAEDKGGNCSYVETTYVIPAADTEKPEITLTLSKTTANIGDAIEATIKVTDNVEVDKINVYLNGELVMDSQGKLTITADQAKIMKLKVVATDTSGNEAIQEAECSVIDTRDKIAPEVNITSPTIGETISNLVEITGTAKDETQLERYKLQYRLKGTTDFTTFAESEESVDDGVLGIFDPTNLANGTYEIRLIAEDKGGNNTYIQTNYLVQVASSDTEKPTINLVVSDSIAHLGDVVQVYAEAKDNLKVDKLELYIDGKLTELKGGLATFTSNEAKTALIKAVAIDTNGNQTEESTECRFIDDSDVVQPTADINTPESDTHITAPTKIVGTAKDETKLYNYKLEYRLKDSKDFTLFKESTESKSDEELGIFDPTMLVNGIYEVRLSVQDMGGNISTTTTTYVVEGEMKIGHMSMGFEDINTRVSGINMSVTRQYDNGNKEKGDFGVGWTMGLNSMKMYLNSPLGDGWEQVQQGSNFETEYLIKETIPHYITVTYGDGKSDTFKATLSRQRQVFMPISETEMNFECTTNSKVKLEMAEDNTVSILGGTGEIQLYSFNSGFDDLVLKPQRFKLTSEDGTEVKLHVTNGIESIKDKTGNVMNIGKDGIKDSSGKGITFTRDSQNRITAAKDPAGNITAYEYDTAGDLVAVKNPVGDTVKFKYDSKHNIIEITDPRGIAVAKNEYDQSGRLVATIDADGNRMEYSHDLEGRREVVRDKLGNIIIITYNEKGNVLSKTDQLGNTVEYTYDDNGNKLTEKNELGNTWNYKYDDQNHLISTSNPLGNEASAEYNTEGKISTIKDVEGNIASYLFDDLGRLKSVKDSNGVGIENEYDSKGRLTGLIDQIGIKIQYTYDDKGNVASKIDGAGNTTSYTYDANGRNTCEKSIRTTEEGIKTVTTSFEYDALGNPVKTVDGEGNISRLEYNSIGKISTYIDKLGNRTEFDYDNNGNIIKAKYPDGTSESFVYDAEGRNIEATNRDGIKIKYSYDKVGRMTDTQYSDNNSIKYDYDKLGKVTKITDANGSETNYEYDVLGRNTVNIDAYGNKTKYEYNSSSRITAMVDSKGNRYEFKYDSYGNRTEIYYPDGTIGKSELDAAGRLLKETDQNGNETTYEYNGLNSLTSISNSLGGKWIYKYDEASNLVEVTDANNNTTKYAYDNNGRLIKTTLPLGMTTSIEYDAEGNVKKTTDFNGNSKEFLYDNQYRLVQATLSSGETIKYEYTLDGQIKKVTDKNGVTTYEYNDLSGLQKKTTPDGTIFEYAYDKASNVTEIKTQYGTTKYEYDLLSRLTKITDKDGNVSEYKYDSNGNRINKIYSNGITIEYKYDQLNRLTEEIVKDASGNIVDGYTLTLGKTGNRTKVQEFNGTISSYEYDALYRLTEETILDNKGLNKTIKYSYDAVGNRLSKNEDGNTIYYEYDANNRLTKEGEYIYSYDNNGSIIDKKGQAKEIIYSYDSNCRLIKVTDTEGPKVTTEEYKYDWQGNRIEKVTNGTEVTRYVVNTLGLSTVIAELDGSGSLVTSYTYGDELISLHRTGEKRYYIFDGFENVRMLADENGHVTDTYSFDGFGNLLNKTGITKNDYLFNGEQYDSNTGFYYLRARYMNPATGRFVTMDPYSGSIFDPVSLHKYLYADANPIDNSDSTGYCTLAEQSSTLSIMEVIDSAMAAYDATLLKIFGNLMAKTIATGVATGLTVGVGLEVVDSNFIRDLLNLTVNDAIIATAKEVIDYVEKQDIDNKDTYEQSVYVLRDPARDNKVVYVGRTNDPRERLIQHRKKPEREEYTMTVVATGLNIMQSRAMEQTLISAYLVKEVGETLIENNRREISKKKVGKYEEHLSVISDLIGSAIEEEFIGYGSIPRKPKS